MRVAVLSGGRSSEHDVSLRSGAAVAEGLAEAGHEVVPVRIERDGHWTRDGAEVEVSPGNGLLGADVVFPVLHGPYGEDGTIQGALDTLGVAYVGPSVLAAAVCIDKLTFKRLLAFHGLPQVDFCEAGADGWRLEATSCRFSRPNGQAAVGEAVAARLERGDLEGGRSRARARRSGRGGAAP